MLWIGVSRGPVVRVARSPCPILNIKPSISSSISSLKCCFGSPVSERTASSHSLPSIKDNLSQPTVNGSRNRNVNKGLFGLQFFRSKMSSPVEGGSLCRQNFSQECEGHINRQINMELYASYVYMSMAYHFDRDDVAFPGLHKFFKKQSDEEREHAERLMKYQNMRGGRVMLQQIAKPSQDDWKSPMDALCAALELEKSVNTSLLKIHGVASANNDPQLCDFLETHYLEEQVKSMKELSDLIVQLKRCGPGLGEYLFDKELDEK